MEILHIKTNISTPQNLPTWVRMVTANGGAVYAELCDLRFVWQTAGWGMEQKDYERLKDSAYTITDTLECKSYLHNGTVHIAYRYAWLNEVTKLYANDATRLKWLKRLLASFWAETARLARLRTAAKRWLTPADFLTAYPFVTGTTPLEPYTLEQILEKEYIRLDTQENTPQTRAMVADRLARYGFAPKYKEEYYG